MCANVCKCQEVDFEQPEVVLTDVRSPIKYVERRMQTINSLQMREAAKALTVLDHCYFRKIPLGEFIDKKWTKSSRRETAPCIMRMIDRFNSLSHWVIESVVLPKHAIDRLMTLQKFIDLIDELLDYNNFNSSASVLAGLLSSPVQKLEQEWKAVGASSMKAFKASRELLNAFSNYGNYRNRLKEIPCSTPCIPYVAVLLRDLVVAHDANPPHLADGSLNEARYRQTGFILKQIRATQATTYSIVCAEHVLAYFRDGIHEQLRDLNSLDKIAKELKQDASEPPPPTAVSKRKFKRPNELPKRAWGASFRKHKKLPSPRKQRSKQSCPRDDRPLSPSATPQSTSISISFPCGHDTLKYVDSKAKGFLEFIADSGAMEIPRDSMEWISSKPTAGSESSDQVSLCNLLCVSFVGKLGEKIFCWTCVWLLLAVLSFPSSFTIYL